jgi:hypothetical protein
VQSPLTRGASISINTLQRTEGLRCTPQSAYTRLDSFLDRFAAFFSFGVRVAFFFSSLLFSISLGMVFAPHICVWGAVIAATDNNPRSVNLARKIREIAEAAERQDLGIIGHRPDTEGHDWNDVQRALAPQPKPSASPAVTTGHANLARAYHQELAALELTGIFV